MTAVLAILAILVIAYVAILLARVESRRIERKLKTEPFVPAYRYEPPCRRRSDNKEERNETED